VASILATHMTQFRQLTLIHKVIV